MTTRHRHRVPGAQQRVIRVLRPQSLKFQVQLDPVGATSHNTALFDKDDYVLFTF